MLSLLPLLLLQVGPVPTTGAVDAVPEELHEQRRMNRARAAAIDASRPVAVRTLDPCHEEIRIAPLDALDAAQDRLENSRGADRATAAECMGLALAALERWGEAESALVEARDAVPASEGARRAQLGAAAAIAAEAAGDFARALPLFEAARAEARAAGDVAVAGRIARDMAHSLNRLGQGQRAMESLAEARAALPDDPAVWLISARLSRQQERLGEAQGQIERAAMLAPRNPEVGLEAGVIAVLGGNEAAARRSWESVVAMAPGSPVAATAQDYLGQLGPQPGPAAR
ncbi:hypothetical protein J4558_02320 [Leptolyngbya sp. 15MV]|nr:hypothetical protein J4558_02320 [Leptolyngbya sp. 15MV]